MGIRFKNIILFTHDQDIHLSYNKKLESGLTYLKASSHENISEMHDREKSRLIETKDNIYLQEL